MPIGYLLDIIGFIIFDHLENCKICKFSRHLKTEQICMFPFLLHYIKMIENNSSVKYSDNTSHGQCGTVKSAMRPSF